MNVIYSVVSPFTGEIIGSGVDMSLHAATPVEVEGKMSRGEIELSVRMPQEVQRSGRQITALHAAVMPFSFKKNLNQVIPVSSCTSLRTSSLTCTPTLPRSSSTLHSPLSQPPSASEARELNLVVRLSTKGMIHSLSKKQITEAQISSEFPQVKSVLSQLEKANVVEITGMIKGSSGSEIQKINSMIVA